MQAQIFCWILDILSNADLLIWVTESQIREASLEDHLSFALARLLSAGEDSHWRRTVLYDAEYLYKSDDLIRLLTLFAEATGEEWVLRNVQADWDGLKASVVFDFHGQRISWTFQQRSDWVDCEFYTRIEEFTRQHLAGAFVNFPTGDQYACHLYLPGNIAAEVAFLVMLSEEPALDYLQCRHIFAEARRLKWLADMPFARLVCGESITSLLEAWLPGHITSRYTWTEKGLLTSKEGETYYKEVIGDLAQLTAGEWDPKDLRCTFKEGRPGITITFDFRDTHFTWLLTPPASRVAEAFSAYLTLFAKEYLSGDFVELRLQQGEYGYLYLPETTGEILQRSCYER